MNSGLYHEYISCIKKSPSAIWRRGIFRNNELAMTYSHMGNPTLPSAQRGFTSEFGKGSGGYLLLLSPAHLFMDTRSGLILRNSVPHAVAFSKSEQIGLFELILSSVYLTKSRYLYRFN